MTFDQLKKRVLENWRAQAKWRKDAGEEFSFVDGHQWEDDVRIDLEEQNKQPIIFNRCAPIIAAVAGSEINNRTEVRFIPREIGDVKANEILSAGSEWFRDQANAEDEESQAFYDLLVCGLGVTETSLDFEEDPEGQPTIRRIDPTKVFWDCHAHRKGLSDARFRGYVWEMPVADAEELFPKRKVDATWLDQGAEGDTETNIIGDEYNDEAGEVDEKRTTARIVVVQWCERQRVVEFAQDDGGRGEMPKDRWDKLAKVRPIMPQHRVLTKKVWHQALLGGEMLAENQPSPECATINFITGHWDRKKKRFYGLLRSMKDPQRFANKWLTQTLHIINTNAKGGVIAEEGAVADVRDFEDTWAAADAVSWVKAGKMGAIKEKPLPQIPPALMALTEFAISSIRDVSGVNLELLGLRDANQPGILEYQRRQSAMTTLAVFFDSMRYYRKKQGDVILYFLRAHVAPTGRLVRIMKEGQEQYIPLALESDTRKYDVIVDDAPSAPNEKEKSWAVIEAMMPMLQQAGLSLDDWADILEYSPLPGSFVERVREKAEQQRTQGPDPMQQAAMQLQIAKEESEIEENRAQAQLDQMRSQQIAVETQLAPPQAQADIRSKLMPLVGASPA